MTEFMGIRLLEGDATVHREIQQVCFRGSCSYGNNLLMFVRDMNKNEDPFQATFAGIDPMAMTYLLDVLEHNENVFVYLVSLQRGDTGYRIFRNCSFPEDRSPLGLEKWYFDTLNTEEWNHIYEEV